MNRSPIGLPVSHQRWRVHSQSASLISFFNTLPRISSVVPVILGLVLVAAAVLKAHQLATGTVVESGLFTSRWLLIALIELELGLGLWLTLGFYPRQARLIALACFGGFAVVSLQQALAGKASCSCFGAVTLRPWYTFVFDVGAIAVLWATIPARNAASDKASSRTNYSRLQLCVVFVLLFLPAGILLASSASRVAIPVLTISAAEIDMGKVPAGGSKDATFSLTNPGDTPVTVTRIESSCHCLKIELPTDLLAPGETVEARVRIDLQSEPDFTGGLAINAKGLDGSGAILFTIVVNIEVPRG